MIIGSYMYEPFGKQITLFESKSRDRMSFIGKEKDIESELGDFGVRKYDEDIGRFTSIDPLWEKYYSWTPYHYCSNNPVMGSDPSGLGAQDRMKYAVAFVYANIPYAKDGLRTKWDANSLATMDCSEFVSRIMFLDGIDKTTTSRPTATLKKELENEDKYEKSMVPKEGDIMLRNGHTGIVSEVDPKTGKYKIIHAPETGKTVSESNWKTVEGTKDLIGFFHPKNETPDDINSPILIGTQEAYDNRETQSAPVRYKVDDRTMKNQY